MTRPSPKPGGRRDARGLQTRQVLLGTAERLFAAQGIARTSTRQITSEAGISRDAIHYHFGSKAALVEAILDWRTEQMRDEFERIFGAAGPGATICDVARALVTAASELAAQEAGRYYHPFLLALVHDHELNHLTSTKSTPQFDIIIERLTPLTRSFSDYERVYRVVQALMLIMYGIGTTPLVSWIDSQTDISNSEAMRMLTDVVTGVLGGESRHPEADQALRFAKSS